MANNTHQSTDNRALSTLQPAVNDRTLGHEANGDCTLRRYSVLSHSLPLHRDCLHNGNAQSTKMVQSKGNTSSSPSLPPSPSPSLPLSTSPTPSPIPVIASLLEQWRRNNNISSPPISSNSHHLSFPPPSSSLPRPTSSSSAPCPQLSTPPFSRPDTAENLQRAYSEPTPKITVSDWQFEEESPALYVFLKNPVPPPPPSSSSSRTYSEPSSTVQQSGPGSIAVKCTSGASRNGAEKEEGFWHGNGRVMNALDILLDEHAAADAERRAKQSRRKIMMKEFWRRRWGRVRDMSRRIRSSELHDWG